jgi:hypothetical protein
VFREVASGAKTDRGQLRRVLEELDAGARLQQVAKERVEHNRERREQNWALGFSERVLAERAV